MQVSRRVQQLVAVAGILLTTVWTSVLAQPGYFPSPEEAVTALIAAVKAGQEGALQAVLGPEAAELGSGDAVEDAAERDRFVAVAEAGVRIDRQGDDRAELLLGADAWPFPIPLVKEGAGWRFDTAAGKEELLNRRIGSNELHAIATVRAIVDAQYEYAAADPMGEGLHEYAQRFRSSEGQRDGLYWPSDGAGNESPLGRLVAEAVKEGYVRSEDGAPSPYHGYFYRLLTAQGSHAPGGARSYLKDGRLVDGFALLAYPAEYGKSGVMTFLVNQRGLVFEKDLGEDTANLAAALETYDPDKTWTPVAAD